MYTYAYAHVYIDIHVFMHIYPHPYTHIYTYIHMSWALEEDHADVQPIPLGVTFSNAVSKLKAQSSNVSFH